MRYKKKTAETVTHFTYKGKMGMSKILKCILKNIKMYQKFKMKQTNQILKIDYNC